MATVKVKFRPSTAADRPGSIVYLVTHRRQVRRITSAYKIYQQGWDRNHSFFCYMENIIFNLRQQNRIGTAHNYQAALGSIRRFRNNQDIAFEQINCVLIKDYQSYLKSAGLSPNSISFYMRILRAAYNRLAEQGLVQDSKPFRTAFTGMEKTRKRAIGLEDIRKIKELDLSAKPALEFARDIFMFLFYCRGMSFVDAAFLKKSDVHNGVINYRRHKTSRLLHIRIVGQIQDIVNRHADAESPYLLPVITRPDTDERKQYESALRRINNALKEIAGMAKLPVALTTYVSRHSWATVAKAKNIPVNVISDALGHDSPATTQIYLASIDASTIDSANELIINDL